MKESKVLLYAKKTYNNWKNIEQKITFLGQFMVKMHLYLETKEIQVFEVTKKENVAETYGGIVLYVPETSTS